MRATGSKAIGEVNSASRSGHEARRDEPNALDADVAPGRQGRLRHDGRHPIRGDRVDVTAQLVGGDELAAKRTKSALRHRESAFERWRRARDDLDGAFAVDGRYRDLAARRAADQKAMVECAGGVERDAVER